MTGGLTTAVGLGILQRVPFVVSYEVQGRSNQIARRETKMTQQDPIQQQPTPEVKNVGIVGQQKTQMTVHIVWGIVALAVVLCFFLFLNNTVPGCGGCQRGLLDIVKGGVVVNQHTVTVYNSFIGKINNENKLVVATLIKPVEISKNDKKLVLFDYVSLGETVTKIRVNECKVQYIILLKGFTENSVLFDKASNTFRVLFSKPMLDKDMVDIPSDPALWETETDQGWARFNGKELEQQAKTELRAYLLSEAENEIYRAKVESDARETLVGILNPIVNSTVPGARLEIVFND